MSAADQERAAQLLEQYEQQAAERAQVPPGEASTAPLDVICEECGRTSTFAAEQRGSVQDCPYCGAYLDVENCDDGERYWHETDKPDGD